MEGRRERREAKRPVIGQYNALEAWNMLQARVPAAVFRMASHRWEGGVMEALVRAYALGFKV